MTTRQLIPRPTALGVVTSTGVPLPSTPGGHHVPTVDGRGVSQAAKAPPANVCGVVGR